MKLALLLIASISLALSCASGDEAGFDNHLPAVRDLAAYNESLFELAGLNGNIELESIGLVEYPGFRTDLYAVVYTPEGAPERTMLITGGVHGNEPAGAAFALGLIQGLSDGSMTSNDSRVEVIPMINPWGWMHDSRYNYFGMDINRDFASFKTQEARIIREYLAGKTFDLAIDHHEDPSATGVYLYQYGKRDTDSARSVLTAVKNLGYPIEQDISMIILKTKDGLINAPMWGLSYMRLTKQLSITNYLRLENSKKVYTVETPVRLPIRARAEIHNTAFRILSE